MYFRPGGGAVCDNMDGFFLACSRDSVKTLASKSPKTYDCKTVEADGYMLN